jgi:hypothetical protein
VITAETRVRTNLQTIIGLGGVVIAAAVWCTVVYLDVQGLKESAKAKDAQLDTMAKDMAAMRSQVDRLAWKLDVITAGQPPRGPVGP